MVRFTAVLVAVIVCLSAQIATAQLTPHEALAGMTRGINLGNTLEPPTESGWNNGPALEYYFDDFKAAGFTTVRVPVRWDEHTSDSPPYTIDPTWMNRVEEVIDWGLERDLIIIMNTHHEEWIKAGYSDASLRARFDSIWTQVAFHFQDKSDSLLFEIINEPFGMTAAQVDDLNARVLPIIRQTNPTRLVIYSGADFSGAAWLMQAAIPEDDYLMGYYHSYDPWEFCGLGNGLWGAEIQQNSVRNQFESVGNFSTTNDLPVMISEFGAIRPTDFNSRMHIYAFYVEQALRNNIAFHVWDDGGDYRLYNREARTWAPEKDILIHTQIDGPTDVSVTSVGDTLVVVSWTNRVQTNTANIVERAVGSGPFEQVAELDNQAASYADTSVVGNNQYMYRVIAKHASGQDAHSYPQRVTLLPTERFNFLGEPFLIPGVIQAEDYDIGGEGLTYHDTEAENIPNDYRPDEGVDIEVRDDGGFQVGFVEPGEWMEYTVDVQETGTYTFTFFVASLDGGGRLTFKVGETAAAAPRIPDTDSWMTLEEISKDVELEVGLQVMRLTIFNTPFFNIDRVEVVKATSTGVAELEVPSRFDVYPNPVNSRLRVDTDINSRSAQLDVVNVLGQVVLTGNVDSEETDLSVAHLPSGVYFLRLTRENEVLQHRRFVKR